MKNGKEDIKDANLSMDIDLLFNKSILKTNTTPNRGSSQVILRNTNFISNIEMAKIDENDNYLTVMFKSNKYDN